MSAKIVLLLLVSAFGATLSTGNVVFPCVTPDKEDAYCVSLFSCPHLMKSLSTLDPEAIDYVKRSVCLGCEAGDVMVCCGTPKPVVESSAITTESEPELMTTKPPKVESSEDARNARREHVKNNLLPSQKYCGQQHTDDRVYTANETALDEFPWMTHLYLADLDEYEGEYGDRCNGVLISNRYVLTDAYCGVETFRIRLGQYNTHKNVTCVEESTIVECTEPTIIRKVEKRVRSGKQSNGPYDLSLIRLNQTVLFTEYIRPICLPIAGSKRGSQNSLIFSGWGSASNTEVLKKRLTYNLADSEVCYNASVGLEGNVNFAGVSFVCLEPPLGNTMNACNGEHGGPMMYKHKHKWFADGIIVEVLGVQSGPSICSSTNPVAGIFIDETMMNWILDSIED